MVGTKDKTLKQALEEIGIEKSPRRKVATQQRSIQDFSLVPVVIVLLVVLGLGAAIILSFATDSGLTKELITASCLILMICGLRLGDSLSRN